MVAALRRPPPSQQVKQRVLLEFITHNEKNSSDSKWSHIWAQYAENSTFFLSFRQLLMISRVCPRGPFQCPVSKGWPSPVSGNWTKREKAFAVLLTAAQPLRHLVKENNPPDSHAAQTLQYWNQWKSNLRMRRVQTGLEFNYSINTLKGSTLIYP